MKIFTKAVIGIVAVIVIILIAGAIFLNALFPPDLSKKETEKDFIKNRDSIMIVTDYLINSRYDDVCIKSTHSRGIMFVNPDGYVTIDEPSVIEAIDTLLHQKGYSVIGMDNNTIHFQRSTRFMSFGSGISYSIDGSDPELQFLTKLEPLSIENWYYYEEDYEEFRMRRDSSSEE